MKSTQTEASDNEHRDSKLNKGTNSQLTSESRLTVVSREAKEEAASSALMGLRVTCVSILQEQGL